MLKVVKIPEHVVINKMKVDGVDPARISEINGDSKPNSEKKTSTVTKEIPEELQKYHRMLNIMKIPVNVVVNRMKVEGVDPSRIREIDESQASENESKSESENEGEIPEELKKYHEMI